MEYISNTLGNLIEQTAFMNLTVGNLIMIAVACVFLYLAIRHGFEPLLLVPIAFDMLLVNIYPDIMLHAEDSANGTGGLLYYFYVLDEWSILPSLIFLGVGAMTDFGPLIANPKSFLLGAAAQFGIFIERTINPSADVPSDAAIAAALTAARSVSSVTSCRHGIQQVLHLQNKEVQSQSFLSLYTAIYLPLSSLK